MVRTCCIIGLAPDLLPAAFQGDSEEGFQLELQLAAEIDGLIRSGVTRFLTVLNRGTDLWAAGIVLNLRQAHPESGVRLWVAEPYGGRSRYWRKGERFRYEEIIGQADEVLTLFPRYRNGCLWRAARYLVENSHCVLAVAPGGENDWQGALALARARGLKVVTVDPRRLGEG